MKIKQVHYGWGNIHGVLHRFNRKQEEVQAYTLPKNPKNNRDFEVRTMLEDHNGIFWIGTTDGLFTFDQQQWNIQR